MGVTSAHDEACNAHNTCTNADDGFKAEDDDEEDDDEDDEEADELAAAREPLFRSASGRKSTDSTNSSVSVSGTRQSAKSSSLRRFFRNCV